MRKGVIAAGNWILDKVKTIDRWPGEGNLCNVLRENRAGGGGPCNVLFDLAAADSELPLYAAGRIGNDADGAFLELEIDRRGIDRRFLSRSTTAATSYTDVMSGNGRRTFFHCRGANAELAVPQLLAIDVDAKFFYLGYLLLLDSLDADDPEFGVQGARLLAAMRRRGMRTVVDFVTEAPEKFRRVALPALAQTDVLIINELEASYCTGCQLRGGDGSLAGSQLRPALTRLLSLGVRELAVIHFPEGAAALDLTGNYCYCPSCAIEPARIVGTNGAGDAFAAGVLYALHEGEPLVAALRLGSAFSYFNLLSDTAGGGAVSLGRMRAHLANCAFSPLPAGVAAGD